MHRDPETRYLKEDVAEFHCIGYLNLSKMLHQSIYTRNTGISSTPIPPPDFLLSCSSRSRRAFSHCRTSDEDERGSCTGSGLIGGDGSGGTGLLETFEDGATEVGVARGVVSRKDR